MNADRLVFVRLLIGALLLASVGLTAGEPAAPPGVVIDHLPSDAGAYIGSPSIAVLSDGSYVASHDIFRKGDQGDQTLVFVSGDRGRTWTRRATIDGQWWSTLFVHHDSLYLMGTSKARGDAVIRRSDDGGTTWTTPTDERHGLLLGGGGYHCAPGPALVQGGRLWRAMEDLGGPLKGWGKQFRTFMMSAPLDADLLQASSWTSSNRLASDPAWLDGRFGGWLEGNAVATPDGGVATMLRVHCVAGSEQSAFVRVSADGTTAAFDPATGFVGFPGGCKKFTIRRDPQGDCSWALTNAVLPQHRYANWERVRNAVALISSDDLRTWTIHGVVLYDPDVTQRGIQYLDWQFDGDDLIAVARTAWDDAQGGAHNCHDANFLTFHRVVGFRAIASGVELPSAP